MAGGDARRRDGAARRVRAPQLGPLPRPRPACCRAGRSTAPRSAPSWRAGRRCGRSRPGTRPTTSRSRPRAARRRRRLLRRAARGVRACTIVAARHPRLRQLRELAARLPRGGLGRPAAVGPAQLRRRHLRRTTATDAVLAALPGSCRWRRPAGSSCAATPPAASCSRATRPCRPLGHRRLRAGRRAPAHRAPVRLPVARGRGRPLRRRDRAPRRDAQRASYAAFAAGCARCRSAAASPGMTWNASWSKGRLVLRGTLRRRAVPGPRDGQAAPLRTFARARTTKTVGTRSYTTKAAAAEGVGEGPRASCGPPRAEGRAHGRLHSPVSARRAS